jgi:predicted RNase H-like HicB family nuclease
LKRLDFSSGQVDADLVLELFRAAALRCTRRPRKICKYEVIIYWSNEDQAFIAEVPELPGCAADGATYQEALANVEVVIQEWIETAKELKRPIPDPKGRLAFA